MSAATIETVNGVVIVKVPDAVSDDAQILSKLKNMQGADGYDFADFGNNQVLVDYLVSRHELYKQIVAGNPPREQLILIKIEMDNLIDTLARGISGPYPVDLTLLRDDIASALEM